MTGAAQGELAAGDCDSCRMCDRREFLRDAGLLAIGALAAVGLSAEQAEAFPLHAASALRAEGDEITYPLPEQDGVVVDREHGVILAQFASSVYAFALACPHQRAALRWLGADGRFQCSKHKSRYRPDGTYISGRATRSMDRFAIRPSGAAVIVDRSKLFREDRDRAGWTAAVVRV